MHLPIRRSQQPSVNPVVLFTAPVRTTSRVTRKTPERNRRTDNSRMPAGGALCSSWSPPPSPHRRWIADTPPTPADWSLAVQGNLGCDMGHVSRVREFSVSGKRFAGIVSTPVRLTCKLGYVRCPTLLLDLL